LVDLAYSFDQLRCQIKLRLRLERDGSFYPSVVEHILPDISAANPAERHTHPHGSGFSVGALAAKAAHISACRKHSVEWSMTISPQ